MRQHFPPNIRIRRIRAKLDGLRHQPFTNIDGETFNKPTMNGFWRVSMDLMCSNESEYLALSDFITSMRGNARTVLPMTTQWLPNSERGRRLNGFTQAPIFTADHEGFAGEPFDGFRLLAPASHRDSYIDVSCPALSRLRPGHRIALGERLHQVGSVTALNESETQWRVSVRPSIRGSYPTGTVVVVDQLKLLAQMESADDLDDWNLPFHDLTANFIEAF